jgi:tRNA pseudouridine13 synthase
MSRAKRIWYLNTFQSHLYNQILARRIDRLDHMLAGDWAMKMDNGACFAVEDVAREQPRADRFEISPTGILFGSRVSWAIRGERRSLRVPLVDLEWTLEGTVLTLAFSLPPGAYATSVLRELMKTPSLG